MNSTEIEESLGLVGWSVEDDGVGGLLKVRVEDFRVEAVSYTHLTLPTKRIV